MLQPTTTPLRPPDDSQAATKSYFLSDVQLDIPNPSTAVFKAKLNGLPGSQVLARAWLSTEADGTLAEVASPALNAGDIATLTVILRDSRTPENAFLRIESAPFKTEHVVIIKLPQT